MNLELSQQDLELIDFLLSKEENETRIAIHHCRNYDFKEYLKRHYELTSILLTRIRNEVKVIQQS